MSRSVMGVAIAGMHYTGMAAAKFIVASFHLILFPIRRRLKLRRAIAGLRAIQQELHGRHSRSLFPEHAELLEVARALVAQLETSK